MAARKNLFCFSAFLLLSALTLTLATCENTAGAGQFFMVSFEADGGNPEPEKQKVEKGGLIIEPEEMIKTGQDFGEWYINEDCTIIWDFEHDIVTEDITLYAKWEPSINNSSSGGKGGGSGGGSAGGAGIGGPAGVSGTGIEALTGSVTITGTNWVGETLTANTDSLSGSGLISYQWELNGIDITGETASTYTPNVTDQGEMISVTVTRDDKSRSVTSAEIGIDVISVDIHGSRRSIQRGDTRQYTATVNNSSNPGVIWNVSSLTSFIGIDGLLSVDPDETADTLTITATSAVDGSKINSISVEIKSPPADTGLKEV